MEDLIASFRQANRKINMGTSVYRSISWNKDCERWCVQIQCLTERKSTYVGMYNDEVQAALAYDAAAIALGKTYGPNFPEKVSEAKITDALLLKLFKTTDRDKVEKIGEQHQQKKGNAMSEEWRALLKRKLDPMPEAPEFTDGKIGGKRKEPAPKGSKKKADMSESSEEDTEEEELPMHDDGDVDNGVNDDNEEAIHEDVQGQGLAAASSHHDGPVPRKRRRRERRVEDISGEEDAEPTQERHAGSRDPGGVGDTLVIGGQPQQILHIY